MFGINAKDKPVMIEDSSRIDSIISAETTVGDINFCGALAINGIVLGYVANNGRIADKGSKVDVVTVSEAGRVTGSITADAVIIKGEVQGNILARSVVITSTARIHGEDLVLEYVHLQIEAGAVLDCKLIRIEDFDLASNKEDAIINSMDDMVA